MTSTGADPDGAGPGQAPISTNTWDLARRLTENVDPGGRHTTNTFDRLDQLVKSRDARNGVTTLAYDAVGNTTLLVDAALNTTFWEYDRLDRAVAETNQAGGRRRMEYDAVSNMVKIVDRNGRVRELAYDGLDRNTQELWKTSGGSLVRTITYAFNAASQMTSASDPDSAYAYAYGALSRVTSVDNNGTPGVPRVILTRSYDTASRRTALSASVAGTADFLNSYSFDTLGRMTRVDQTGQTGGNTVAPKRVDFEYNAIGDFSKITRYKDLAGGSTNEVATSTFGRDALGRLTSLDHKKGATNIANYTWQFDTLNRVTQFVSPDGTTNYSYDATSQVILADHSYQVDESLVQDLNGNRALAGHTTADDNRLTSDGTYNYEYDAEGNRTRRVKISDSTSTEYEWDHRNRLTLVTDKNASGVSIKTVAFAFDVFDRRIVKIYDADGAGAGGTVTSYWAYDGEDIVLAFNGSGAITNRYLHGPAVDQVMADEQVTGGTGGVLWILPDNQGTARDLVDSTGAVQNHIKYDTYGKVTAESNAAINHLYGYGGRERDEETGLNYHRARWYDPITGRWLSQDPIGFAAGDTNLYRYVFNGPTNWIDPSGLDAAGDEAMAEGVAPTPPTWQETWGSYVSTQAAAPHELNLTTDQQHAIDMANGDVATEVALLELFAVANATDVTPYAWLTQGGYCHAWANAARTAIIDAKRAGQIQGLYVEHVTPTYTGWGFLFWEDHAVLVVTLPNGEVIYVDNFYVGGSDDHIFFEIPDHLLVPGTPEYDKWLKDYRRIHEQWWMQSTL